MLELRNVVHSYPGSSRAALQGIDLQLQAGECLGLLGSNGAGKTTLLSLLSGVLALQQGELRWEGQPRLGLVPQQLAFYAGLKVGENLELFADLYRLRGAERRQRLQQCIDTCALEDKLTRRSEQLSGGEQRRLNFAIGLLQPADLYLFDEATVGVDAANRQHLLAAVEQLTADGKALLGSTDGIPFADSKGRWEYDGKELILELTRTFDDVKSTFSTTRVFIGDVIALNDVPPQVQGAIKMTPSPTSDDMLRIPRHTLPTDAVGYFVAVKIPEIPGAL